MGYVNKRDKANAIKKVKIAFGERLGCDKDEDAEIIVREPTEMEVLTWRAASKDSETNGVVNFKDLLVGTLVSHNLMEDENEKMTNEAVADLIYEKSELTAFIMETWAKSVFTIPPSKTGGK